MKKAIPICLVLFLTVALAFAVSAQGGKGPGSWMPGFGGPGFGISLVETLGLTEDQVAKVKELQKDLYGKTKPLRNELQDVLFELRQLRLAKDPDQAAIEAEVDRVEELREQLSELRDDYRRKMEAILTEEQLEKMKSIRRGGRVFRRPRMMGLGGWWF